MRTDPPPPRLRQLHFAYADLYLHSEFHAPTNPTEEDLKKQTQLLWNVDQMVQKKFDVLPRLDYDRFLCSFQHIFAGGYAAGYYSYKWAEVLSADAFSAFEDNTGTAASSGELPLKSEAEQQIIGHRFADTVLAKGGGEDPMDVFKEFRGRAPKVDALLRHSGLVGPVGQ